MREVLSLNPDSSAALNFIGYTYAERGKDSDTLEMGYSLCMLRAGGSALNGHYRDPYLLETSVPGIFCAGDVRSRSVKRIASAVGEGSMAVQFVHQHIAGL